LNKGRKFDSSKQYNVAKKTEMKTASKSNESLRYLGIHQVGVLHSVTMNLTLPERVTLFNLVELSALIANRPGIHPSVKHIGQMGPESTSATSKKHLIYCLPMAGSLNDNYETTISLFSIGSPVFIK